MGFLLNVAILFFLLFTAGDYYKVTRVVDGDTIVVEGIGKIVQERRNILFSLEKDALHSGIFIMGGR